MTQRHPTESRRSGLLLFLAGMLVATAVLAQTSVLYSTGFEVSEGFTASSSLIGQAGWEGDGSGGNSVATGLMAGQGQSAFLGYYGTTNTGELLTSAWYPLGLAAVPTNNVVRFSARMMISYSQVATNRDYFLWFITDTNGSRLLVLDFDNGSMDILYRLQTGGYTNTGHRFTNGVVYELAIVMDYFRNRWSATLQHAALGTVQVLATNLPFATTGTARGLGEIQAVWYYYDPNDPGDNAMVFDNYRVTLEPAVSLPGPATLGNLKRLSNGWWTLRLRGDPSRNYAIDLSTNLNLLPGGWTAKHTNRTSAAGWFDYTNTTATGQARNYYRARSLP